MVSKYCQKSDEAINPSHPHPPTPSSLPINPQGMRRRPNASAKQPLFRNSENLGQLRPLDLPPQLRLVFTRSTGSAMSFYRTNGSRKYLDQCACPETWLADRFYNAEA